MYWFVRFLVLAMMAVPVSLAYANEISIGDLCLIATLALILVELTDINQKLKS
jgi:hypothetical protein